MGASSSKNPGVPSLNERRYATDLRPSLRYTVMSARYDAWMVDAPPSPCLPELNRLLSFV